MHAPRYTGINSRIVSPSSPAPFFFLAECQRSSLFGLPISNLSGTLRATNDQTRYSQISYSVVLVSFTPYVSLLPHSATIRCHVVNQVHTLFLSPILPSPIQSVQVLRPTSGRTRDPTSSVVHITHLNNLPLAGSNFPRALSFVGRKFVASWRAPAVGTLTSSLEIQ